MRGPRAAAIGSDDDTTTSTKHPNNTTAVRTSDANARMCLPSSLTTRSLKNVLDNFDTIRVCTHYLIDGERYDYFPYDVNDVEVVPVYEDIKGWNCDTTKLTSINDAPAELKAYVEYLERNLEVPITVVSVV